MSWLAILLFKVNWGGNDLPCYRPRLRMSMILPFRRFCVNQVWQSCSVSCTEKLHFVTRVTLCYPPFRFMLRFLLERLLLIKLVLSSTRSISIPSRNGVSDSQGSRQSNIQASQPPCLVDVVRFKYITTFPECN